MSDNRTKIIAMGTILGLMTLAVWGVGQANTGTTQDIGTLVFDGDYYLTAAMDIQNNTEDNLAYHDIAVYGKYMAWVENEGDILSGVRVYDLELDEEVGWLHVNDAGEEWLYNHICKPILTRDYLFVVYASSMYLDENYILMYRLDDLEGENDIDKLVWSSADIGDGWGSIQCNLEDTYDANDEYLVWIHDIRLHTLKLVGLEYNYYDNTFWELDDTPIVKGSPSINDGNTVYFTCYNHSGQLLTSFNLDTLTFNVITGADEAYISGQGLFSTAYDDTIWKYDFYYDVAYYNESAVLINNENETLHTSEGVADYSIEMPPHTNPMINNYPISIHNQMGTYLNFILEYDSINYTFIVSINVCLVNFESGDELILMSLSQDDLESYWYYDSPIRQQMIYQYDNGTYVIATEGSVNVQYLISMTSEDGKNLVNLDRDISSQQEQIDAAMEDKTLFLTGSLILIATFVYAVATRKDKYYEG